MPDKRAKQNWKETLYEIIFEAETFWGKTFDVVLLIAILLSVLVVTLESVESIRNDFGMHLYIIEWIFTIFFTIEYIIRIIIVRRSWRYIRSFFGIVDLLSIIPTYLSIFITGAQSLLIVRSIRLLRVFRVLKMVRFLGEASQLTTALKASRAKITVFIGGVFAMTVIMGTLMYMIEGAENGFTSIPRSIYWAVVTLTTVGYGDIAPQTALGQGLATFIMILGYGIIAVPTGIVTAEMTQNRMITKPTAKNCPNCNRHGHDEEARFCKFCGEKL